jgi:uncharacterized protein
MDKTAEYYIEKLKLQKHPEGGAFREVYRADEEIPGDALPERFGSGRAFSTSIYFLLNRDEISVFHKIKSDETWHFYSGSSLTIYIIDEDGKLSSKKLGGNLERGEMFQVTVPENCWFGAEVNDKNSFSLVGCTVSPGFDFRDFELAGRKNLLEKYGALRDIINRLTKE